MRYPSLVWHIGFVTKAMSMNPLHHMWPDIPNHAWAAQLASLCLAVAGVFSWAFKSTDSTRSPTFLGDLGTHGLRNGLPTWVRHGDLGAEFVLGIWQQEEERLEGHPYKTKELPEETDWLQNTNSRNKVLFLCIVVRTAASTSLPGSNSKAFQGLPNQ